MQEVVCYNLLEKKELNFQRSIRGTLLVNPPSMEDAPQPWNEHPYKEELEKPKDEGSSIESVFIEER